MARRSQAARESMPEGDFRDWKEIESWANGIAEALPTVPDYVISSGHIRSNDQARG